MIHAELLGIPPVEQIVIANIARYHRGARPRKKHGNYGALDKPTRDRIKRLSAVLRIADGLDRGHMAAVADVKVRWLQRAIRITPVPKKSRDPLRLEIWGAHHKSELLSRVAGVPVEIVAPTREVFSSADVEATAAI